MKKILIVLSALLAVVIAGGDIFFIATFDADRYRPMLVQKVSETLKVPVELGRLSLTWKNGVALRLEGLALYADGQKKIRSVQVKELNAVMRLMPLLSRQLEISSVDLVSPSIILIKNSSGALQVAGIQAPASGGQKDPAQSAGLSPLFSVGSFSIRDGQARFEDLTTTPPTTILIRDLDAAVKNFSFTKPFSFDVTAAVFSGRQNLRVNGVMQLPRGSQKGFLRNTSLQSGLADLDIQQLAKAVPAVASAGLEGNLGGKIEVRVERLDLDPSALSSLEASIKLQNVAVKLRDLRSPFERIQLEAKVAGGDIQLDSFSAQFAKGTLSASARVKQWASHPASTIQWSSRNLSIDDFIPPSAMNAPRLGGKLSLDFTGSALGLAWPQISRTLSGQGHLSLQEGVLLNYNLLREVIQKISIIPGAEGVLQEQLPGLYKAKLGEPSTLFQPIEMPFVVQGGQVTFEQLLLVTDLITLQGSGRVGLDPNSIDARTHLRVHKDLSGVMVGLVPQVGILRNASGEVEIPVQIRGQLPRVSILPDKEYLTQKLLATHAQQLVTGFVTDPKKSVQQVRNLFEKPAAAGEAGAKNSLSGLTNLLNQAIGSDQTAGGQ